jgi:hypothetical protein
VPIVERETGAAVATQTTFGMRRCRMSMTAAVPSPTASAARTMTSDAWANGRPEDCVQVFAKQPDGTDCHDRNERGEHRVLEQVLPFIQP